MSVKIRLTRLGDKKSPFYRVVVADSRKSRDGEVIANLGYYNPLVEKDALKIDEAKKLIRKNNAFVEIAEKLCFDSLSTFAFVFKKHVGMTPSEYRNSIK